MHSEDEGTELRLEAYKAVRAYELELHRATIQFEHAILAPLFLLNGGAAVAFLTLLGASSDATSGLQVSERTAGWACAAWAVGLAAAAIASYLGFQSQRRFTRVERLRRQELERAILPGPTAAIVAPDDDEQMRRKPDKKYSKKAEREAGWSMQVAFQWTAASSVVAFLVGGVLAGLSVGLL